MTRTEFAERVRCMERRLYRISRTMLRSEADCEDAVQETLLKAWARLETLRQDCFFETWMVRILINECKNQYRKRPVQDAQLPENLSMETCETSCLFEALMALADKHRIVLELHYIEGYKTREIAKIMGLPEGTIKWRLVCGRRELKRQLGEEA